MASEGDEEVEGPVGGHNARTEEANARLRWSLIISQQETELWKEQAEKTRTEHISFKSNAKGVQIELEYTQGRLDQAQSRLKQHEELVSKFRAEIESKDKLLKGQTNPGSHTENMSNSEALRSEFNSSQTELDRMRDEHRHQAMARLAEELRAEIERKEKSQK
ncbi:hypothetical protein EST38_g12595 [Candolleomyces aberdarensis]|uniref:Uncharacterized protein n=1 Tax=Candolleomyces aberdarensis TaxID=2316362 RepID=A0A4V1Q1Z0_9AGAR|nr:hypothetical protein EST38_g12595 [Candolleomyces aberdarensis]